MGSTLSAYYLESSQMRLWSQTQPDLPENVHYFFSPGTEGERRGVERGEKKREKGRSVEVVLGSGDVGYYLL